MKVFNINNNLKVEYEEIESFISFDNIPIKRIIAQKYPILNGNSCAIYTNKGKFDLLNLYYENLQKYILNSGKEKFHLKIFRQIQNETVNYEAIAVIDEDIPKEYYCIVSDILTKFTDLVPEMIKMEITERFCN